MSSLSTINNQLLVKKSTVEWVSIVGLFLLSFMNSATLLLFMIGIMLLIFQKEMGALKILNLITLRTVINDGVAINISSLQSLKWAIIFVCSFYLLAAYSKLDARKRKQVKWMFFFLSLFAFSNIITAYFWSSLPLVAVAKLISYVVVFAGIVVGIGYTSGKFNWLKWITPWFYLLLGLSILTLPFKSISYQVNGWSFQGIINHPNMFGIIALISVCLILTNKLCDMYKNKYVFFLMLPIAVGLLFLSNSRTSFFGCLVLIGFYLIITLKKQLTYLKVAIFSFVIALILLASSYIFDILYDFLLKGQTQNEILLSRESQIDGLMNNFYTNPFMGTGFSIPYIPYYRSYSFNMDSIVESGNLILAVLSFSGVIGFVLFCSFMFLIFISNLKQVGNNILLFFTPILISMGEMVFFSSNNVGIFCYMFLALYMFQEKTKKLETNQ